MTIWVHIDNVFPFQVIVGNFESDIGQLDYENNLWENMPARIGLCVSVAVVVPLCLIIVTVCSLRKKINCCQKQAETPDVNTSA